MCNRGARVRIGGCGKRRGEDQRRDLIQTADYMIALCIGIGSSSIGEEDSLHSQSLRRGEHSRRTAHDRRFARADPQLIQRLLEEFPIRAGSGFA